MEQGGCNEDVYTTDYNGQQQHIYICKGRDKDDNVCVEMTHSTSIETVPMKKPMCLPKSRSNRRCLASPKIETGNVINNNSTVGTSNQMNHHLQNLFLNQKLCDLVISVDDRRFSLHKIALTSHSNKYLTMFVDPTQTPSAEIRLEGVRPDVVEKVRESPRIHFKWFGNGP